MTTTLAALEHQRADLVAAVGAWPGAHVVFRPGPGAWSAVEVLDHLARTERAILATVRLGLDAPHPLGVRDRAGVWFLDWLFRSERRVRVPASAATVVGPDATADFAGVARAWAEGREDLAGFLAPLAPAQLTAGVFRHPVAGWMSVPQVLRFFWVHAHHHGYQLARLRAAAAGGVRSRGARV